LNKKVIHQKKGYAYAVLMAIRMQCQRLALLSLTIQ